ncbi:FMN-linked oxidoreductase [Epithele typhae]|uniref:FMN-linked oxidoreductase n=1 Tax=Epithele typhae TaxID=378194 RepID=UPI0020071FAD|nr:FMN-linked oxidoreductase [Epithele typhae]KAH9940202.1 FMN-linked oxidoreductase [Epithele typhae]
MSVLSNTRAPNTPYFTPLHPHPAGTAAVKEDEKNLVPTLFQPFKIRGVEFHNRLWNGVITPWHMAHLGSIFTRGPGLCMVEATAVSPEGRITPECAGLWTDAQGEAWSAVVRFAHSQGQKIGVQLAHAGRKASTLAPFVAGSEVAAPDAGGWPDEVVGPSALAYRGLYAPKALTKEGIENVVAAFAEAAKRAVRAGFDVIEIHGAHGFLLSSFMTPTSNTRTDEYGGSWENRTRIVVEVVDAIRAVIPETMPLFLRVSATEWLEESLPDTPSWRVEDTVRLAGVLAEHGVDVIDISSSGTHPDQRIISGPAYQVPFAEAFKRAHGNKIFVLAVGSITSAAMAQDVLDKNQADLIFIGRLFQKNPGLVWAWAEDLGVDIHQAGQHGWPFKGRA